MADLGFGRDFDTQDTGDGSHMVNSNLVACLSYIAAQSPCASWYKLVFIQSEFWPQGSHKDCYINKGLGIPPQFHSRRHGSWISSKPLRNHAHAPQKRQKRQKH